MLKARSTGIVCVIKTSAGPIWRPEIRLTSCLWAWCNLCTWPKRTQNAHIWCFGDYESYASMVSLVCFGRFPWYLISILRVAHLPYHTRQEDVLRDVRNKKWNQTLLQTLTAEQLKPQKWPLMRTAMWLQHPLQFHLEQLHEDTFQEYYLEGATQY